MRFSADNKVLQIAGCTALPLEQGTADCRVLDKQMMLSLLEGKSAAQLLWTCLSFGVHIWQTSLLFILYAQKSMSQLMQSGRLKGVLYVDG